MTPRVPDTMGWRRLALDLRVQRLRASLTWLAEDRSGASEAGVAGRAKLRDTNGLNVGVQRRSRKRSHRCPRQQPSTSGDRQRTLSPDARTKGEEETKKYYGALRVLPQGQRTVQPEG